jgi:hypothetical protein
MYGACQATPLLLLLLLLLLCPSHLQAVEAAAIIHLQEGPSPCACLTTCLHPATNTQRLTNLEPAGGSNTGLSS